MPTKGLPKKEVWYTSTLTGVPHVAAELGELSATWAFLEHMLVDVLAKVLKIPRGASEAVLFALSNSAAKLDVVEAVASRHAKEPMRKRVIHAIASAKALAKRRNRFVHHLIGYDARGRLCLWDYREPADTQSRRVIFRVEDIDDLIIEMRDVVNLLQYAVEPSLGPPKPLPRTHRKPKSVPGKVKVPDAPSGGPAPPSPRRAYEG